MDFRRIGGKVVASPYTKDCFFGFRGWGVG